MASVDDVRSAVDALLAQRKSSQAYVTPPPVKYVAEMDSIHLKIDPAKRDLTARIVEAAFPDAHPAMGMDNSGNFDISFENNGKAATKAQVKEKFFDDLAQAASDIKMLTARVTAAESPTSTSYCLGATEAFGGTPQDVLGCTKRGSRNR